MGIGRLRRRTFLRLSAAIAGTGLLRVAHGSPLRKAHGAKVVIAGGGFAGAACALTLRHVNPGIDVTLVDPDERYVTCPMSNGVLAGYRSLGSISVARAGLARAGVRYVRGRVGVIDARPRRVQLDGGGALAYDRLVMACGIRFLWGTPQGYDEAASQVMPHAWQAGSQTEILAAQLRAMPDGGVVAISVPTGPMRCPPGPFERATLIAGFLRERKPRCKVLIFDANNRFPRQDAFTDTWHTQYPGMIEWIPVVEDGAVVRVEPAKMLLHTAQGTHRVDVANIIPPQAPGKPAAQAGLASDHGWCPVKPDTFESLLIPGVHVIGDACIADPMPKSASAANAQARQCALAIAAALEEREPPLPVFESVCYSMLSRATALSIHGRFRVAGGEIQQDPPAPHSGDPSPVQEARNAEHWYQRIVADSFGL